MAGTTPTPMSAAYSDCMNDNDCERADSSCVRTSGPSGMRSVCAPPCFDVVDCPVPEGAYDAVLVCEAGFCVLDCTGIPLVSPASCPGGMVCVEPELPEVVSYCFDDGL
jgi:hypothetical protein